MTDEELLAAVKKRIGITGDYQDDTISGHIQDVKDYMADSGVSDAVMESDAILWSRYPWCIRSVGLWERKRGVFPLLLPEGHAADVQRR